MHRTYQLNKTLPALRLFIGITIIFLMSGCSTTPEPAGELLSPGCPVPVKGGNCLGKGYMVHICSNHRHTIKGNMKNLLEEDFVLKGSAGHSHVLVLNGGHVFKLEKNQGIQVISNPAKGHNHTVTINCRK